MDRIAAWNADGAWETQVPQRMEHPSDVSDSSEFFPAQQDRNPVPARRPRRSTQSALDQAEKTRMNRMDRIAAWNADGAWETQVPQRTEHPSDVSDSSEFFPAHAGLKPRARAQATPLYASVRFIRVPFAS
jgi:hypothetical protein